VPGQGTPPTASYGLGRLTSWEAWPAQASTAYQPPWPSRRQPEVTGGVGQWVGVAVISPIYEAVAPAPLCCPGPGVVLHGDRGKRAGGTKTNSEVARSHRMLVDQLELPGGFGLVHGLYQLRAVVAGTVHGSTHRVYRQQVIGGWCQ